jgi:signal transduction histidine kinase
VLDKTGVIIVVNKRWLELPHHEALLLDQVAEGVSYLDVCRQAAANGDRSAAEALPGVESVLDGRATGFSLEYRESNHEETWYAMSLAPLQRTDGGAVVSHVDVTERKYAELEAQRARQDLWHVTRLSAVRDIVMDIIDDDRRAGDVIRRLREIMTKANSDPVVTDANALIRDVVMLTGSDTIIRNVALKLDLANETPHVRGDRIELQQVMLNLLVNAMDAVTDRPVSERGIVVRSEHYSHESVLVSVKDSGPGLPPGTEVHIFEPFFTTKPAGMGMGLAIARTIVESYGGHIWATNNKERGATLFVRLPFVRDQAT